MGWKIEYGNFDVYKIFKDGREPQRVGRDLTWKQARDYAWQYNNKNEDRDYQFNVVPQVSK